MSNELDYNYEEYEGIGTYHRNFEIPSDWSEEDIMNFILDTGLSGEQYQIRYQYNLENDPDDHYGSTDAFEVDEFDLWVEDVDDDSSNYGLVAIGGYSVTFIGRL